MTNLKEHYLTHVVPKLAEEFKYANLHQIPKLEKIHISAGGTAIGSAGTSHSLIKSGVVTLVAGVATVSDSNVKNTGTALTNSRIIINRMDDGGTPGDSYSITRINGTSFTITSKSAGATQVLDTSTVSWLMINP